MKASVRKVSEMTVDELRDVIRDVIADDIESWRETFAILSDKRLMQQIRKGRIRTGLQERRAPMFPGKDLKNV